MDCCRKSPVALMVLLLGSTGAAAVPTKAPPPQAIVRPTVETVASGLVHPWALQFLPDGRMLVTERPGRMRIIGKDGRLSEPIAGLPQIVARSQGGLLDVRLDASFPTSGMIYFCYSEPRPSGGDGASVARARLVPAGDGGRLEQVEVIFRQEPPAAGNMHYGCRIVQAHDSTLFVALGERFRHMEKAQDLTTHYGKVVRIAPDGSVPKDNPFVGRSDARPEIWSYGHRNPQAAALHPVSGRLWIVEHGARGGDEINIPGAGKNYGWPVISYGRHYTGERIGTGTSRPGMEQPIYYWDPSIAPSGMAFYTGEAVPAWKGNLFVGSLVLTHLNRLVLQGETVIAEERLLEDLGERIRDVRQGPDGLLYLLTDSPEGRVLRVGARPD